MGCAGRERGRAFSAVTVSGIGSLQGMQRVPPMRGVAMETNPRSVQCAAEQWGALLRAVVPSVVPIYVQLVDHSSVVSIPNYEKPLHSQEQVACFQRAS